MQRGLGRAGFASGCVGPSCRGCLGGATLALQVRCKQKKTVIIKREKKSLQSRLVGGTGREIQTKGFHLTLDIICDRAMHEEKNLGNVLLSASGWGG